MGGRLAILDEAKYCACGRLDYTRNSALARDMGIRVPGHLNYRRYACTKRTLVLDCVIRSGARPLVRFVFLYYDGPFHNSFTLIKNSTVCSEGRTTAVSCAGWSCAAAALVAARRRPSLPPTHQIEQWVRILRQTCGEDYDLVELGYPL